MTARKIGIAFRKSRHEIFFQLLRSEFANYELMEIDVNTGDRGICVPSFYSIYSFYFYVTIKFLKRFSF